MHTNYYQLPPDGTGKKVFSRKTKILSYTGRTGTFTEGETVVGASSGLSMRIIYDEQFTGTTGVLVLAYLNESNEDTTNWTDGENLQIDAATIGQADGIGEEFYGNMSSLVSHDNPYNGLLIDHHGQAYIRYLEGDQLLDASGKSITSQQTKYGIYHFSEDALNSQLSLITSGGGSVSYDIPSHSVTMETTNASGDHVHIMSDKFHPVEPDQSLYCEFSMSSGDNGKTNLLRRAGMYYELNGFFMELHDLDFSFIIRSNSTGSVVDTHVTQADFNGDPGDGTGISRFTIDFTNLNKYWMDYNPNNRIRIGTFDEKGGRITFHTEVLSNSSTLPSINCSALPIMFELKNDDTTASSSEMKVYNCTVTLEGEPTKHLHKFEKSSSEVTVTSSEWTPIVSIKPDTLLDGNTNRSLAQLGHMSLSCVTSADGSVDGRIKVEIFEDAWLSGGTYSTQRTGSHFLIDTDAVSMSGGVAINEHLVKGTADISLDYLTFVDTYLCNKANGDARKYTLACKAIREDCRVLGAITWKEIEVIS